ISRCSWLSFSRSRPTNTIWPCFATSSAVALPIPEVGPVMTYALRSVGSFTETGFGIFYSFDVCLVSHSWRSKKSGDHAPHGVEALFAVLHRMGRILGHEVHGCLRDGAHDSGNESLWS